MDQRGILPDPDGPDIRGELACVDVVRHIVQSDWERVAYAVTPCAVRPTRASHVSGRVRRVRDRWLHILSVPGSAQVPRTVAAHAVSWARELRAWALAH